MQVLSNLHELNSKMKPEKPETKIKKLKKISRTKSLDPQTSGM